MSSKIKKIKELEKKLIEEKKETETRKRNERTEKWQIKELKNKK